MFLQPTPGQQFFTVRLGSVQAMRWLIEDLTDLAPSFGAEQWDDGTAMVIVVDADLDTRQRMERYGSIVTWRCKLDLTGEYTSYGLEAKSDATTQMHMRRLPDVQASGISAPHADEEGSAAPTQVRTPDCR